MKIIYPHGEVSKEELGKLVEFAIEGRRRVKEQLKKMGSFEYYQTSFSYSDRELGEEKFVGVPEQGGRDLVAADPLAPGSVYTGAIGADGTVGLYRLEVTITGGTGKLKTAGGVRVCDERVHQPSISYLLSKKVEFGMGREIDNSDFHVEAIDLLNNGVEAEVGVAFFVAAFSALRHSPVTAATLILGDLSIQGNIKEVRSLTEPLQLARDNGVKKALVPIENKRQFLEVSGDIMEHVDPVFYGDPKAAAFKALGMN